MATENFNFCLMFRFSFRCHDTQIYSRYFRFYENGIIDSQTKNSNNNINNSGTKSKVRKTRFPVKRGQYHTHTDADFDILLQFHRIDDYNISEGKSGSSISEIAREIKVTRPTLSRWYNEWVESDRPDTFECLTEHRGRPKSMTEVEETKRENILSRGKVSFERRNSRQRNYSCRGIDISGLDKKF